ncbi:MAG TPA: hypothetical protein VN962_05405 [Polyangia bacterium]|nr:hypothetical protein [Polyangia bacterium]
MKVITKDLLMVTGALIAAYLILTNYTGFSKSVSSLGSAYVGGVKALQGRG